MAYSKPVKSNPQIKFIAFPLKLYGSWMTKCEIIEKNNEKKKRVN